MAVCAVCNATVDPGLEACPACGVGLRDVEATSLPPTSGAGIDALTSGPPATRTVAASEARYLPGTLLQGRYRIVGPLGKGGMGEVYRAEDTKLGQTVALKFLPVGLALDAAARERFYAEVRIGRQVSHPNVCRLYDLIEVEGQPCLSMEYVDGEDLATLLRRIGRLPVDKAVDIARDVCAGLAAVHDKGVVHRDLKPANIMIDGRGRARLTDFGIAALAEDAASEGGLIGTLAYLAPEQLDGASATVQSDLYALGLVLFEAFTGQAVFAPRSVHELRDLQLQTGKPSFTGSVRDAPPGVERVLQRCLARDPALRPASALEVLAEFPGGDPLQRALAAGETPTPAMVAAAGAVGDLGAPAAWALLLSVLALLFTTAWMSSQSTLIGQLRPELAPPVLEQKALEVYAALGLERPRFRRGFFDLDASVLQTTLLVTDPEGNSQSPLLPLRYTLRGGEIPLVARERASMLFTPTELGRVSLSEPPMTTAGHSWVMLDARGRLVEFLLVPPARIPEGNAAREADWSGLLAATGLDPATLREATPQRTAPVDSDRKRAWMGAYPDLALPIRVEAASLHGRPVYFSLRTAGEDAAIDVVPDTLLVRFAMWSGIAFGLVMLVVVVGLARNNVRQGRGDRGGALRIGLFLWGALFVGLLIRADHAPTLLDEFSLVMNALAQALLFSALASSYFLAFEPVARRTWPRLLISWTRLLSGRWRDPMVGRDVLLGVLGGAAMIALLHAATLVPSVGPHVQQPPLAQVVSSLSGLRYWAYFPFLMTYVAVAFPIFACLFLYLLRALLRWMPLAHLANYSFHAMTFGVGLVYLSPTAPVVLLYAAIWYGLFARVGLLAAGVALYTASVLYCVPFTLDSGLWYADRTWLALGGFGLLAIMAFRLALAGKSAVSLEWVGR